MKPQVRKITFQVQFDSESSPYNTRNNPNIYLKKYLDFRQVLIKNLQQFVPIDVVPKDVPRYYNHLTSKKGNNLYHDTKHNKLVHFPRRDSFQVSVDNFVIFSRLQMGGWPDTNALTEWALRVHQKIADIEAEQSAKEHSTTKKNSKVDQKSVQGQILHRSLHLENDEEPYLSPETLEQKLPPISQTGEYRASMISNYTTLPVREERRNSRYSEEKHEEDQLPQKFKGQNLIDFQATKYVARRNNQLLANRRRKPEEFRDTIYYADSRPRPKNHSFHWNLGVPRSLSKGKTTIRVNQQNPKKDQYRHKNVQLAPLPVEVRADRDRVFSDKLKQRQKDGKIQKAEISISESSLNCYRHLYDIEGSKIKKISNSNSWSPLICENPLPLKGLYYFAFSVIRSVQNMIQIGIAPLCYYPRTDQPEADFQLLSFNCSTGMIKDSKLDELANKTTWRLGGQPAPKDKSYQMRVAIDTENYFIDWYIEDSIVASSKIPKIYHQGFRVILSLYHANDSVLINEEDWKEKLKMGQFDKNSFFIQKKASEYSQRSHNSQNSRQFNHSQHSQAGKVKKVLSNSPRKEESPQTPAPSERLVQSYIDSFSPISLDQEIQTDFVGRIRRQRILKYKEKRGKIEQGVLTDNLLKEDDSPVREEEKSDPQVVEPEKKSEVQNVIAIDYVSEIAVNKPEEVQVNQDQMKWIGTYGTHHGFQLKDPKEVEVDNPTPSIIEKDVEPVSEVPSGKEQQDKKVVNQSEVIQDNLITAKDDEILLPGNEGQENQRQYLVVEESKEEVKEQVVEPKEEETLNKNVSLEQPLQEQQLPESEQKMLKMESPPQEQVNIIKPKIDQKQEAPTKIQKEDRTHKTEEKEDLAYQINKEEPLSNEKVEHSDVLCHKPEQLDSRLEEQDLKPAGLEWKAFYEDSIFKLQPLKA